MRRQPSLRFEVCRAGGLRPGNPPVNRLTDAMSVATFRALVDELPELRHLTLEGAGEPLLTPCLSDMIRYANSRKVRVTVQTNGSLLYRDRAAELVDARLDQLRVLTNGTTTDEIGGESDKTNFGPLLENLAGLMAERRATGLNTPAVQFVFVPTAQNILQLPDIVALLGGIWVDEVQVRLPPVHQWDGSTWTCLSCGHQSPDPCDCVCHDLDGDLLAKVLIEARAATADYGLPLNLSPVGDEARMPLIRLGDVVQGWRP